MNTVLLTGNGFDLSLGFKTSYKDFLESKDFTGLTGFLPEYLKNKIKHEWIDIEREMELHAHNSLRHDKIQNAFKKEYVELSGALKSYIGGLDFSTFNKESAAYVLMGRIAGLPMHSINIFNFNYSNLLDSIRKSFPGQVLNNFKPEIWNIHGTYDSDIIFGVHDHAIPHENLDLIKFTFIVKSLQKGYDPRNILKTLKESKMLIIFGHSLGETDHSYFLDFFQNSSNKIIKIFYYGDEGLDKLRQQIHKLTHGQPSSFQNANSLQLIDASNMDEVKNCRLSG
jgi:Bacteriophage abortive infection AbiH